MSGFEVIGEPVAALPERGFYGKAHARMWKQVRHQCETHPGMWIPVRKPTPNAANNAAKYIRTGQNQTFNGLPVQAVARGPIVYVRLTPKGTQP